MQTTTAEIEAIVRVVVERLRAMPAVEPVAAAVQPKTVQPKPAPPAADSAALRLEGRLVTLEQLGSRLDGIRRVQVGRRAVLTPAVLDELRRRKIRLERVTTSASGRASAPARLMVIAPIGKGPSGLDNEAQGVRSAESTEVSADTRILSEHLALEGAGAIWWSMTPFAASMSVRSNDVLRAVQLSVASDLDRALGETNANLLIVDGQHWSAAAVANLARAWLRRRA